MVKEKVMEIAKTALGVVIIYIVAVLISLYLCHNFYGMESKEDKLIQNENIVMGVK